MVSSQGFADCLHWAHPCSRSPRCLSPKPVVYVDAFDQRMQGSTIRFVHAIHNAMAEWEEAAARESGIIFADPTNGAKREMPERGKTSETSSSML